MADILDLDTLIPMLQRIRADQGNLKVALGTAPHVKNLGWRIQETAVTSDGFITKSNDDRKAVLKAKMDEASKYLRRWDAHWETITDAEWDTLSDEEQAFLGDRDQAGRLVWEKYMELVQENYALALSDDRVLRLG